MTDKKDKEKEKKEFKEEVKDMVKKSVEEKHDKKAEKRGAVETMLPVIPISKSRNVEYEDKLSHYSSNVKGLVNTLLGYYRMKVKNRDTIIESLKEENRRLQERMAILGGSSEEYEDIIEDLIINRNLFSESKEEDVGVPGELEYLWPDSAGYIKPIFDRFKIGKYDGSSTSILEQERQNKRKRDENALNGVGSGAFKRD